MIGDKGERIPQTMNRVEKDTVVTTLADPLSLTSAGARWATIGTLMINWTR
jgi:hypothetical protein